MRFCLPAIALSTFLLLGLTIHAEAGEYPFVFRDTTAEAGLLPEVGGIRGHAAGWGDLDRDGFTDLYVGTFHNGDTKPNLLFRNRMGKFSLDEQSAPRISARSNSGLFVDLDNDGDLDLYVASMPVKAGTKLADKEGHPFAPCSLFRNDGKGKFTNISEDNRACPAAFGGRSATALDFDGDGLLDLLVGEDPLPGYNGSPTRSSRLFRNLGELKFADVSQEVGLPAGIPGLGVLAADFNNDTWPDFFLAAQQGGNVLLLNDGKGKFREAAGSRELFAWPTAKGDNMCCGACCGDVNRDGLLDIVLGQHFEKPWTTPVANRLYLNLGVRNGEPTFEDITEKAGLIPLPLKSPHVELQDFDNDGWPDLYGSLVKFADDRPYPLIFKHVGLKNGWPRFEEQTLAVNDFPTEEDRKIGRTVAMFEKINQEGKIAYFAPGPSGDYDNDGRLDLFLASWWPERPSLLLHNETKGGNWLQVQVDGKLGLNCMGVGSRVNLFRAGRAGVAKALLGSQEIMLGFGYVSGHAALAHFGLGKETKVDVEVVLPHGKGKLLQKAVAANQRITVAADSDDKQQPARAAKAKSANPASKAKPAPVVVPFPPTLPEGKTVVTDKSADFLKGPAELKAGVTIAKTPPTIDFLYYPGQDYPGNPWSNWGDSLAVDGKYYSAIGDHLAANSKDTSHGTGTGRVFEYDPEKKSFRLLADVAKLLNLPEGHYVPGKIHSRLDQGSDGWIYFSTHRGSTTVTTDKYYYEGDWILRCDPQSGKAEVVVRGPVPKHCIPNSVLDPERLIFYGGTASGNKDDKSIQFFAYDCRNRKLLYAGPDGPARYMMFAKSTGRLYYVPGNGDGELLRYEPQLGAKPEPVPGATLGVRAATQETPQGLVYTISTGQGAGNAELWSFNTKTEKVESLGPATIGSQAYVASLDADPSGRYLYYVPGAHGGSERDGSAVIQFDTKTRSRKVIAFLHPFYQEKYGAALKGTYATAVDPAGDKLYITWNVSRGSKAWDSCALTVIHIPLSERPQE